ncbi:unnamed protein product, partial [Laminaria digitata]
PPPPLAAAPRPPLAHHDSSRDVILSAAEHPDRAALEGAIIAALADAFHHAASPGAKGLDAFIAARAVRDGAATSQAVLHALQRDGEPSLAPELARYPGLAARAPSAWRGLGEGSLGESRDIWPMLLTFTHREGLGLVSALQRSQGFDAVALAMQDPPTESASVVSPKTWMRGGASAAWSWPVELASDFKEEGFEQAGSGRVGASMIAAWLARGGQASWQTIRVVPAAWKAGAWQVWRRGEQTHFVWVTQWEAPTAASRIAQIFEATLAQTHGPVDQGRWAITTSGLDIAVIISSEGEPAPKPDAIAQRAVLATPTYPQRDAIPLPYVPSQAEQLVTSAGDMTLEANQWSDPGLALEADLSPLATWKKGLDRQGMIRWWAKDGGMTIQLTAELGEPLGPEFGSEAYNAQLEDAMKRSIRSARITDRQRRESPLGPILGLRVEGELTGTPRVLQLWHFQRGEHLLTLSINAPVARRDEALTLSSTLLASIRPTGALDTPRDPRADDGILEFKVEDE